MKVIAHRGASGEFPENSLLAFEQAIVQGADAIELDVHYHEPSGEYIVIHDKFVDKTTEQQGEIDSFSLSELSSMSVGQGQYIVTLATALSAIDGKVPVNIELKSCATSASIIETELTALSRVIDLANSQFNFNDRHFIFSSFNLVLAKACLAQFPDSIVAALIAHIPLENDPVFLEDFKFINMAIDAISAPQVNKAHRLNKKVWVYTVDQPADIEQCKKLNVDGIFTNFPERARHILHTPH